MTWKDRFYEAVAEMLRGEGFDSQRVTDIEQETESNSCGYGTCDYSTTTIDVTYVDSSGRTGFWTYDGNIAEFLDMLG